MQEVHLLLIGGNGLLKGAQGCMPWTALSDYSYFASVCHLGGFGTRSNRDIRCCSIL